MVKLTPTGVKIKTNLVWTSHNTGGVEFNTRVFAVYDVLIWRKKKLNKMQVLVKKTKQKTDFHNYSSLPSC